MQTQICNRCQIEKQISEFSKLQKSKSGFHNTCKSCRNAEAKEYRVNHSERCSERDKRYKDKYPWRKVWNYINQRCHNPNSTSFKGYGSRGIKNLFKNWDEIKFLWFRDNASLLEYPSIDRINEDGDYCLENCRFIDHKENALRAISLKRKPILQYDLQGNFITEYNSIFQASKINNCSCSSISACARGEKKTANGFIWKFKI